MTSRAKTRADSIRIQGRSVDPELLRLRVADPAGPMGGCTSQCCLSGVFVGLGERDRVLAHADAVRRQMDADQVKDPERWFTKRSRRDADFEEGRCVGTRVHRGRCVFLNGRGLCTLQLATAADPELPQLKPFFCRLFPLVISEGRLEYDPLCKGESRCCTFSRRGAKPVVEACRAELELALGAEGVRRLRRLAGRQDSNGDAPASRPVELG